MRMFGIIGSRPSAGAKLQKERPQATMAKDGYKVISECDDHDYRKESRRGTYRSPTRDHLFKPEDE